MPSDAVDFRRRAQLTEWMDEPCTREQLRACLRDLARVNRWLLAYRPVLRWLNTMVDEFVPPPIVQPLRILNWAAP